MGGTELRPRRVTPRGPGARVVGALSRSNLAESQATAIVEYLQRATR